MMRLSSFQDANGLRRMLKEQTFELIRREHYPDLPSRLNANFVCETVDALTQLQKTAHRGYDLIYKVTLVDSTAKLHRACIAMFNSASQADSLEPLVHAYWQAQAVKHPEVITLSPLRIEKRING